MSEGMPQSGLLKPGDQPSDTDGSQVPHMFYATLAVSAFRIASEFVLVELPLGPHIPASFLKHNGRDSAPE